MSKLQQLQAEGRREFEKRFVMFDHSANKPSDQVVNLASDILSFQDSLIARAFEEGRKVEREIN